MKNLLIILVAISVFYISSGYANEPDWQGWSEDTLIQAKENNRLVLIDLTAQWCKFCKKMEQTTYKDEAVINELQQNFIAIKADEDKYPELASRFAKVGRPGTIILDSNGNQLMARTGYIKPQWMLWMLQGTLAEFSTKQESPTR